MQFIIIPLFSPHQDGNDGYTVCVFLVLGAAECIKTSFEQNNQHGWMVR